VLVLDGCWSGPGGPVKIAVNTKVRYPLNLRSLLVFYGPQAIRSLTGSYYCEAGLATAAALLSRAPRSSAQRAAVRRDER
jgi:hypothetical protein